jgi:sigma-B regulation protein RsbU (phosphoserine phosphatase)
VCAEHDRPADALLRTNEVLQSHASTRFCTAVCLRLRREGGEWHGRLSSAGHALPLLRSADGQVRPVGRPGALLNVLAAPPLHDAALVLRPGDLLLMCTDGLAEGRRDEQLYGDERIADGFGRATGTAQDSLRFQGGTPRDDIAIVVLRVPDGAGGSAGDPAAGATDAPHG